MGPADPFYECFLFLIFGFLWIKPIFQIPALAFHLVLVFSHVDAVLLGL